ncbi:MAG: insulinase family protein [Candidatus Shikimatogenerans sp. AspAUS03]|uniref:Insulinase family protein n=1 Tax=Candidatus Shikimatogenerans sp. AspAUS03 TaxID=3158563 RepID=A0AAU7QSS2_9FLAO
MLNNKNLLFKNMIYYVLNNGIKIFINKNIDTNLLISVTFFFHVGSKNDLSNLKGITYLLKHYIYKYFIIKKLKDKIYLLKIKCISFVNYDGIYFCSTMIKDQLNTFLNIMSKIFKNININEKLIYKLIDYIKIKQKYINKNYFINLFYKKIPKYIFIKHNYKNLIIGIIKDLVNNFKKTIFEKFYYKYFNSQNMCISLSGDLNIIYTKFLIIKYFYNYRSKRKYIINNNYYYNNKFNNKIILNNKYSNLIIGIIIYLIPNSSNLNINYIKFFFYLLLKYKCYLYKINNKYLIDCNLKFNLMEDCGYIMIYYIVKDKYYLSKMFKSIILYIQNIIKYKINKKNINKYIKYLNIKEIYINDNIDITINAINNLIFYKDIFYFKNKIKIIKYADINYIKKLIKKYFKNKKEIYIYND